MQLHYPEIALHVPSLLLPRADIPLETWSVIACDQYTSQPEYWEEVRRLVGNDPSTLQLIFPEAYLGETCREQTIAGINQRMQAYLKSGVLAEQRPGFMLVEREVGTRCAAQGAGRRLGLGAVRLPRRSAEADSHDRGYGSESAAAEDSSAGESAAGNAAHHGADRRSAADGD